MAEEGRRKKIVITAVKLCITTGIILFIGHRLGWADIRETVVEARPAWLVGALGIFMLSGVLGVVQWRILLENRGIPLSFRRAFSLYFIGLFFMNFILGTIAGDAVKIAYIRSSDKKGKEGFAATFLDRFAGLWAMAGFAVVGGVVLFARQGLSGRGIIVVIAALCIAFAAFLGVLFFLLSERLQRIFFRLLRAPAIPHRERIESIVSGVLIQAHDRHIVGRVALLSTVIQFLRVSVHILCAGALGLLSGHSILYFFIFIPIIAIIMIMPLPFGVKESIEGTLFTLCGFEPEAAVVMGFLASIVGIIASLFGGVLFVLRGAGRKGEKTV